MIELNEAAKRDAIDKALNEFANAHRQYGQQMPKGFSLAEFARWEYRLSEARRAVHAAIDGVPFEPGPEMTDADALDASVSLFLHGGGR